MSPHATAQPLLPLFARRATGAARGFTLVEVLIAIGILAIGLIAVASLFPAGLILQREAIQTTQRQSHTRSLDALLTGLNLNNDELLRFSEVLEDPMGGLLAETIRDGSNIDDLIFDVYAVAEVPTDIQTDSSGFAAPQSSGPDLTDPSVSSAMPADEEYRDENSLLARFPLTVRCLPTGTPSAGDWDIETPAVSGSDLDPDFSLREIFWVPFVRRGIGASSFVADWNVYAFILQPPGDLRDRGAYSFGLYPSLFTDEVCANPFDPGYFPKVFRLEVTNVPNDESEATFEVPAGTNMAIHVRVGDPMLGDNGTIYTVSRIDGRTVGLNADRNFLPLNRRDLRALWLAPALSIGDAAPVADVRLLSNSVVRANTSF